MSSEEERSPPVPFVSRSSVEAKADEVSRLHGLSSIPRDPVVLANRLGIRVHNAKFADESIVAMIAKRGDEMTLLVNQGDPPFRKRFSIAHELGHHFLHLMEDGEYVDREADLFRSSGPDTDTITNARRKEIQANWFAAAFLMPASEVKYYWGSTQSVERMARIFNVSEEAMGYRINTLNL